MCLRHDIDALKGVLPALSKAQGGFATSLIAQFEKKGDLSEKQRAWVKKLYADNSAKAEKAAPAGEQIGAESLTGLVALFATAKVHLQKPRIRLELDNGEKVVLSLAPASGKNAGFIYVKVAGEYAGKVSPEGEFFPFQLDAEQVVLVKKLFVEISTDPASVAAEYGKDTGSCCFCGITIKTDASLAVGYGPDCADHYGLPWGEVR